MAAVKETPGSTTRLIVDYVAKRLGEDGVSRLLELAGITVPIEALLDDSQWSTYADKIALFEAASTLLEDPDVAFRIGNGLLEGPIADLVHVIRAIGSPGEALRCIIAASSSFSPESDMDLVELGDRYALISYRLHDGLEPSRHECLYTASLLRQIGPIFELPPADVDHDVCRLDGADACLFRVTWASPQRAKRIRRRERRAHVEGLSTRFWELESQTPGLVSEDDPTVVLAIVAARAAEAIGASGHVLVVTDPGSTSPTVIQHGLVGSTAALVDGVLSGLEQEQPNRIVVELATERRRYGHLVLLFDEAHRVLPEERTIITAYARRTAVMLEAAHAIRDAREREETASMLLDVSRALSEVTSVAEVATRITEAVPSITGSDQSAVLLWSSETRAFHLAAATGYDELEPGLLDGLVVPLEDAIGAVDGDGMHEPLVVPRAAARGIAAQLMDEHRAATLALVPIRVRSRLHGVIVAGWRAASSVPHAGALQDRLAGLADQVGTALENATLLEQMRHQALHDALTGLPNQTLFADRVETALVRAGRNRTRVAVGVLDLDRFKIVNDSLGHTAGDQLLVQVSERLSQVLRAPDTIARMGGDEFTLLLPDVLECGEAIVAERILEAFVQPFEVDGHRLRISPSIGLAVFPEDGDTFEHLLRCADVAMYRAKERGRNTWACYASGMAERAYDRLTLENDLYRALQRRELRVVYQPMASVADGRLVGIEALVRWAHPTLGLLLPDEFLPIAEDLGLMAEIDGWVLRQACLELGGAVASGLEIDHVAVNLSGRTLCHPAVERLVVDALTAGGLDPSRLVIEISESITAELAHSLGTQLKALRARGVRVALDDFGRGSSALSRLAQLPIDRLKVDATFLAGITDASAPSPVVEAIVAMGHGLGLEVCAEGVETDEQRDFAARVGFDIAQGWLLGRPTSTVAYAGARSRTA